MYPARPLRGDHSLDPGWRVVFHSGVLRTLGVAGGARLDGMDQFQVLGVD